MNIVITGLTTVAVYMLALLGAAHAQDKVTLALDWIVNGTHSGYFVAKSKGFYNKAGLNVEISRGFGSGDTVKRVSTGSTNFGIADASAAIASRANEDVPLRIVAAVYGKAPLGIIFLKESGVKGPSDFVGRKIARTASGSSVIMFPAFLQANKIDRSKIEELVADANVLLPMLMSRRVDGVLGQTVHVDRYKKLAFQQGLTATSINYSDYGLDAYGNAIVVGSKLLETNPDLVSRFVEASLKGVAYALANPDEAAAIVKAQHPEADLEVLKEEIIEVGKVILTDEAKAKGIGFASPERIAKTIKVVSDALKLKREPSVDDVFSPAALPKVPVHVTK